MKLHWFSPLPPTRTGIADFTAAVVPALAEVAEVTLWTDRPGWDTGIEAHAKVIQYDVDQIPWRKLNEADACIYNIGNHCHYHANIWRVSQQHPGVVILHDTMLHDLFYGMHKLLTGDKQAYLSQLERYYGEAGRRDGEDLWEGRTQAENMAPLYSMLPVAMENATGTVVHTDTAFEAVKQSGKCPVASIPLAAALSTSAGSVAQHPQGGVYRLILFGHIGRNRRLESFLHALQLFRGRHKFHLDVYGEVWDAPRIDALVKTLQLQETVTLHGFVPDQELDAALGRAHLAINLRYPTMGEASISQLQIWRHALPTLVSPVGWYANLSREIVAFVDPENEVNDIHRHLNAFLSDPAAFAKMGGNGRRKLEEEHSPANYAREIPELVSAAMEFRCARPYLQDLPRNVASILGAWLPPGRHGVAFSKVAGELQNLGGARRLFNPVFEEGWYAEEMDSNGETWHWSKGDAEVDLHNPVSAPCEANLQFEIGAINVRDLIVLKDGVKILQLKLSPEIKKIEKLPVTLAPGKNRISFKTDLPPVTHPGSTDPRPFAFVLRQFCKD